MKTTKRGTWRSLVVALLCLLVSGGCSGDRNHYPSPDDQREVVIEVGNAAIDTVWIVSVVDTAIFGDGHIIGCFTDDVAGSATPSGVSWTNSEEFVIATTGNPSDVRVTINSDGTASQVTQITGDFLVPCPFS